MERENQIRPNQDPQPPIVVEYNDSRAEIYNADSILEQSRTSDITIFDRGDFASPIERLTVELGYTMNDYDEHGHYLQAKVKLDKFAKLPHTGYSTDFASLFGSNIAGNPTYSRDVRPGRNYDRGNFETQGTSFPNVVLVRHKTGNDFFVWINNTGEILVGNSLVSEAKGDDDNPILQIRPRSEDTVDSRLVVKDFWKTVIWTADEISKTYGKRALKRNYLVGQNPKISAQKSGASKPSRNMPNEKGTEITPHDELFEMSDTEISLDDVGGLDDVKQVLKEVAVSFSHPEIMAKWGAKRPQGVLLYGEPGTGKTMLVEALANEMSAKLWQIRSTDIYDKWLGNSEQKIQEIFNKAKSLKERTILLFDEFDSIIGIKDEPESGGDTARNAVAGIFKQEMNTLVRENPNILVVATTNHSDRIDDALIRAGRFDYKVYVPMPNDVARRDIMTSVVARSIMAHEQEGFQVFAEGLDLDILSRETDGFSGADIAEIFRRMQFSKAMQEAQTGEVTAITQDELVAAIRKFRTNG